MKVLFSCMLCLFLFSCKDSGNKSRVAYNLEATEQIKNFILDSDVRYNAFYLYPFCDGGKEYLSFLNYRTNQILFYDLKTTRFLKKIELNAEGPDGIVQASGFYIKDFNNIFVSSYAYNGLIKVDTTCHIIQKIPYGETNDGYKVLPSYKPSSHPYVPPIFIKDKMYITQPVAVQFCPLTETPLSVEIDTVQKQYKSVPLTYSVLTKKERQTNDIIFSRIFDGVHFVYSFSVSENIQIASVDHSQIQTVQVKSKYIDYPADIQELSEKGPQQNLELARYGDLLYDPYREVYYRFAYPQVSLDNHKNWWGKAVYGRKKFSVIILDKNFEIIGETLFPEAIYNSYVFFVHKDGLYISRDYQMLDGTQSEDYMTFELFKLSEIG